MNYNKDLIQWKKDKKKNAEDPNAVLQRRKKAILEQIKEAGEPIEERFVYREIRGHFKTHQDYFLMLQGLVKEKLIGVKPIKGEHRRRRYFIKDKGLKIIS
jgi:hypothetical protein